MEGVNGKKIPGLLPPYFKKIGLIIALLVVLTVIGKYLAGFEAEVKWRELTRVLVFNGLVIGLGLIALSKDKVEDEMTIFLRLKAMAFAFLTAVLYFIIFPFVLLFFKDPIREATGFEVIVAMLLIYLLTYYFEKRNR